jgi:hypothetical protein
VHRGFDTAAVERLDDGVVSYALQVAANAQGGFLPFNELHPLLPPGRLISSTVYPR